jgi:hypothetical protein
MSNNTSLPVFGVVEIDLSDNHHPMLDRQRLDALDRCPDGVTVRIVVGDRVFVSVDAARWLHRHHRRLAFEIVGSDPMGVQRFIDAARTGTTGLEGVA